MNAIRLLRWFDNELFNLLWKADSDPV